MLRFMFGVLVGGALAVTLPEAAGFFTDFVTWVARHEAVQNLLN